MPGPSIAAATARRHRTRPDRLRIIVSGMLAGVPGQGGATWAVLQYVLGLRQLGHDVLFVEPVGDLPAASSGPAFEWSPCAGYFRRVTRHFGLEDRAALLLVGTRRTVGVTYDECRAFAGDADLLVNLSGMLRDPGLLEPVSRRLYVDLDPVFTQLWSAVEHVDMRFEAHTDFATVGLLLGSDACDVPTCGLKWIPTLQPVALDWWPVAGTVRSDAFTTVANWRGYGSIHHGGVHYGQKAHSTRRLLSLPRLTGERIQLALSIHPDETRDLEALRRHGWTTIDARRVSPDPCSYRAFVQGSKAEIGIAKSGYVHPRSGWFSDRSTCYLASGRPVVAQDTGWAARLPTGEGLFAFTTAQEAASAMDAVSRDYARHARRAREVAESFFDSRLVLRGLLERVGATA